MMRSSWLAWAYGLLTAYGLVAWRPALLFASMVAVIGWAASAAGRASREVTPWT